jgi:thiosulfate/3-mercaptopyruvate sulfurtransferase
MAAASNFTTTSRLAEVLIDPDTAIVDSSWYLPNLDRNARVEYLAGHIPGAVFFDIDAISDPSSGLPHMLPEPSRFAAAMGELGIADDMRIVVYDGMGLFSAPRVWWTFKVFGARDVTILEGGLPQWLAEGRPLEQGAGLREPRVFTPRFDAAAVVDADAVRRALESGDAQVLDARSAERFRGDAPEPRPGVRAGHMPGSLNLHYAQVIADGRLRPAAELAAAFETAGVDLDRPVITTCGSGITAAILKLGLEEIGKHARLYDGSWAEWGSRHDLPIATGAAEHD